ncbi:MAG: DoxX family protein [Candidatus Omnitrophica bacterium]|nr:DoxX family protein [Candidatus Omnitrophota bacterium]MDD5670704.1 DoxX family protein [Candidatus Omnitrophota bacterium]
MKKQPLHVYPPWFLVRIIVGIIFIYSGMGKLLTPLAETRALFYQYAFLPAFAVPWIALLFPWVEFITGSFLVLGYMTRLAATTIMGFTFCFIVLLGSELLLKGHFPQDCGCFAGGWKLPTPAIIFMDVVNFFMSLQLARLRDHRWSLDQWLKSN